MIDDFRESRVNATVRFAACIRHDHMGDLPDVAIEVKRAGYDPVLLKFDFKGS